MTDCALTGTHYREILDVAHESGYDTQSLATYYRSPGGRALILRHDVDVSLDLAVRLAEIELAAGASSSYFVRVHAAYNPFSRENLAHLHWLEAHGFDVGLHHEVGNFHLDGTSPVDQLKRELATLEAVLGRKVRSVAAHLPKRAGCTLSPEDLRDAGLLYEAGDAVFNRDVSFVSDSNAQLKPSCLCTLLGSVERIYAAIHPVWWVGGVTDPEKILTPLLQGD